MNEKNYYEILGISKDATGDEIKKAYRNLIKQYHPDKFATKSKEDQEEAQKKTIEINEAYAVLGDPQKRKEYDSPKFSFSFDNFNPFGPGFMGDIFGGMGHGSGNMRTFRAGQDISITLDLDMKSIYEGFNKTFKYIRKVRCACCEGKGGQTETCLRCHGTGQITDYQRSPFGMIQTTTQCPSCKGLGYIVTKECTHCKGQGLVDFSTELNFTLPPEKAIKNNSKFRFNGKGYESPDKGGPNGSLFITLRHNYDTSKYHINYDNSDITETVHIPYLGILLGCEWPIKLPTGEEEYINIPSCLPCNTIIEIPEKGINGGKYFSKIVPQFPEKLSDREREILQGLGRTL